MAKAKSLIEVECPCCGAALKIDPVMQAVISHKAKEDPRTLSDIAAGVAKLKEKESQRDTLFEKQFASVKSQKDVLNAKFDELLKQAKADPNSGPPRNPFDLD